MHIRALHLPSPRLSPKAHFPAFFPSAPVPWPYSLGKAASLHPFSCDRGTTGTSQGVRGWQETMKEGSKGWHCLLTPQEEKELFHTCISHHPNNDLSRPVSGLCTAIKLCWNGKVSLYKSRSKLSIFYDGGHSLI